MLRKGKIAATGERRSYQGVWDEVARHASSTVMLNLPSVGKLSPTQKKQVARTLIWLQNHTFLGLKLHTMRLRSGEIAQMMLQVDWECG